MLHPCSRGRGSFYPPGKGELKAPSYNSPRHNQGMNQTQALPRSGGEAPDNRFKVHPGGRTRDRQRYNTVQRGNKGTGTSLSGDPGPQAQVGDPTEAGWSKER